MQPIQKISCACLIILFAQLASAQSFTNKGTIELGGDISFSSLRTSESDESLTTFTFNPYIGCMVSPEFEMGLRPQISMINNGDYLVTSLGVFLATAYNANIGSNVYPYFEFLIGFNSIMSQGTNLGGFGVGADGGLKIHIKGNSLLLMKLEYLHQEFDAKSDDFSINTLSFGLGFRVFFPSRPADN